MKNTSKQPHIWKFDQETTALRRSIIIHWIRSSITIWIMTFFIILIYLGGGVNLIWYTCSLDVFVTDLDHGLAGASFIEAFEIYRSPCNAHDLQWIVQSSMNQSIDLIQQIEEGQAWASIVINHGTTDRLNEIVQMIIDGNFSYNCDNALSTFAVTIIYDEGRNFNTINNFILPRIQAAISHANIRFTNYLQSQIVLNSVNITQNTLIASIAYANIFQSPFSSQQLNLHPAEPFPSFLATTLGYLLLWLVMVSVVQMILRLTQTMIGEISIIDIILVRQCLTWITSLVISAVYTLVILWLSNFTQAVPFVRFWLFNWLATMTFTAILSLFMIHFGPVAQICLPLFLVINLSASSSNIAIELQHPFYRIAYGLPLYHCFAAARHFLFGSYTRLHVDLAVLFAYYFGATFITIATCIYQIRHKTNPT